MVMIDTLAMDEDGTCYKANCTVEASPPISWLLQPFVALLPKTKSSSPDKENVDPAGYIVHRCSSGAVKTSTGDPVTPRKCPPGFDENDKDTKNCVWSRNCSVSSIQFTRPPLMNTNGRADHNIWKNDFDQKPELVNLWIDENWLIS
uniref:AlNc14C289G10210 protein n=1 Tax=Albugo laibachii Nc14 TaxID=890382 RepID=F0WV65_9STRA|nr:AlNc14C289G10210 [Albugo laibachii Nc14]|eukprot:CCA25304.1 AlNc14C289G10210 [Albugo laibachii Nc14]